MQFMELPVIDSQEFDRIFLDSVPLLDVRAEIEFKKGAFPQSINLPILSTSERQKVGAKYQKEGSDAAIDLGLELVQGPLKQKRLESWQEFFQKNPKGYLYCFRGGLRSRITQQWLEESGTSCFRIEGGYKALRNHLLQKLEMPKAANLRMISGRTGTGKTHVIKALGQALDLEGRANHRGSAFGRRVEAQPSQVDFENQLAIDIMKQHEAGKFLFFLEDESHCIGSCHVPLSLYKEMKLAGMLVVEEPLESRVDNVLEEYVIQAVEEYQEHFGESGFEQYREYLLGSLQKIKKRLGGSRLQEISQDIVMALDELEKKQDPSAHRVWITKLLCDYYDPMYDYQLQKSLSRVLFTGSRQEVLHWCEEECK